MSERQTVQRWMITVGGVEQARVGAGQSVEIGRKPIRPLREDGFTRIDIVDNKRSMSKRHALLIVDARGVATIRDLHSTNGTYLVGENGDLLRLEPDIDFQLPDNLMRMQFGDVPVDFVRVEDEAPQEDSSHEVRDLFSYATDDINDEHDEPAAANLSVDQILDLRAGEPTGIFHAQSVSKPGLSWKNGVEAQVEVPGDFKEESATASGDSASEDAVSGDVASGDVLNHDAINHDVTLPVMREQQEEPVEQRNLFDDAKAMQPEVADSQENSEVSDLHEDIKEDSQDLQQDLQQGDLQKSAADNVADNAADENAFDCNTSAENVADNAADNNAADNNADAAKIEAHENAYSNSANAYDDANESSNAYAYSNAYNSTGIDGLSDISDINASGGVTYTPAFEPGSVFEKVSKGEFDAQQNLVEVGGFTSKEAEESADFSQQFEMAQHSELLPYLAANPNLYDDLYTWLQAQGNPEVDAALARNSGYSAYRKAVEQ